MQIVITMAGLGTRFKKVGYDMPKYEITAHGKSLFSWSLLSLADFASPEDDWYFIVRSADNASGFIKEEAPAITGSAGIKVIEIDDMTDGQATTAMLAAPFWKSDDDLMIYNIDTFVEPYNITRVQIRQFDGDGFIPCFNAPGDHWSFVSVGERGYATEVREKKRISDNCTIGAYWFSSCGLYERMYNEYYKGDANLEKGEKYVAPLYNHMIGKGMKVGISVIECTHVHVLGTPEELKVFENEKIGDQL